MLIFQIYTINNTVENDEKNDFVFLNNAAIYILMCFVKSLF